MDDVRLDNVGIDVTLSVDGIATLLSAITDAINNFKFDVVKINKEIELHPNNTCLYKTIVNLRAYEDEIEKLEALQHTLASCRISAIEAWSADMIEQVSGDLWKVNFNLQPD